MVSSLDQGPYVKAAFFCEHALQEADGVLSAIRIVDRIMHTEQGSQTPEEMPPVAYKLFVVAILVPGRAKGRHPVRLDLENPAGELRMLSEHDLLFEGEDRNVALVADMRATFTHEGLHWLHVSFDGHVLTKSPLRVIYQRVGATGSAPPPA